MCVCVCETWICFGAHMIHKIYIHDVVALDIIIFFLILFFTERKERRCGRYTKGKKLKKKQNKNILYIRISTSTWHILYGSSSVCWCRHYDSPLHSTPRSTIRSSLYECCVSYEILILTPCTGKAVRTCRYYHSFSLLLLSTLPTIWSRERERDLRCY